MSDIKVTAPASAETQTNDTDMASIPENIPDMSSVVNKVIKESDNFITALESVGAMYGIPSENIIIDDSLKTIKIVNDNILAPSTVKNVPENTKAIVCSIGSVLDYISQRIDDKLDKYQKNAIRNSKRSMVRREANPAKGNVIGRYDDDNGDEIIVYDTGMVDMANTREAQMKVDEIRQSLSIPMYSPEAMRRPSYFSDEDDITNGVDMDVDSSDVDTSSSSDDISIEEFDIAEEIQESYYHLDLISKFNNTRHLGYDLLRSQGFDYVKPSGGIIQEADDSSKKKKDINIEDIKHMKFDNTQIIKAIKYMNEARKGFGRKESGKWSPKLLMMDPNWIKAVECLNKQFNCLINICFFDNGSNNTDLYTTIYNDIKTNITISKSKGFQLNGMPIVISCVNRAIDEEMPDDPEMFGQFVISGFLHEIFHNIASAMRIQNDEHTAAMNTTMLLASSTDSAKKRREIITRYVDSLNEYSGKKLNILSRRKLIKQLLVTSASQRDENMLNDIKQRIETDSSVSEKEIDALIKKYEKIVKQREKRLHPSPMRSLFNVVGGLILSCTIIGIPLGVMLLTAAGEAQLIKIFKSEKHFEEYYCDLFAGMYKLPLAFLIGNPINRKFTANNISSEKLNKLAKLEKALNDTRCSIYPTVTERTYAATKIAKNILECGEQIDPVFRDYCQWIIDNHSNILNTDIENNYTDNTFDPKDADDLDKHLQNIIDKSQSNITLTEYDISYIFGDVLAE